MKTILRNFLSILRRFRLATILNVLGLSVAFISFMVITMQINYDKTFDLCHKNPETIYRIEPTWDDGNSQSIVSRPVANLIINSSPHIVKGGLMQSWANTLFFFTEKEGKRDAYKERFVKCTPEIIEIFDFHMVEGRQNALTEPNKVLIPLSMAQKLFGKGPYVGQMLIRESIGKQNFTIGGVYQDLPRNSSMGNHIYMAIDPKENIDSWGNWNYNLFVRLDDEDNLQSVQDNIQKNYDKLLTDGRKDIPGSVKFRFTPLPDMHFITNVSYDNVPKASRQTILVLSAISLIILVIAGINFTNFSTALTPMRIKSINTQKVLGSSDRLLRASLVAEAVVISITAYLIAIAGLYLLNKTSFTSLVSADISITTQWPIVLGTAAVAAVVGVAAGIYPAFYITSFSPALVLKGSFGLSPKGRKLRSALIGIQFISSFALIIGALFMYMQNHYMQNAPTGYDKDAVVLVEMNENNNKNYKSISEELKSFPEIYGVAYSNNILSSQDAYMGWGRDYLDKSINYQCIPVSSSFLDLMGIKVTEGRGFRPEDDLKDHPTCVFNEKARTMFDMKLGTKVDNDEIVGFIEDVKFASFRTEVSPMAFLVWGNKMWGETEITYGTAYVKLKAGSNFRDGIEHIRKTLQKFDPDYPYVIKFYDEVLQQTYEQELRVTSQITLFSLVAIFICIVGVFGLVVFDSEYRRKEISVRKVMGATSGEIIMMFNRSYIITLVICFAIGAPLAYVMVSEWLKNFAYRTPVYWWVFAVAFIVVAAITILTVTFQNWQAANENPVNNIKGE